MMISDDMDRFIVSLVPDFCDEGAACCCSVVQCGTLQCVAVCCSVVP